MDEQVKQLRDEIFKELKLKDSLKEKLTENTPLFENNFLHLDSIDIIGIIVLLNRNYGFRIKDPKEGKKILQSLNSIYEYILKNSK